MSLSFGVQPFWFWNGDMKDEKIMGQVQEMANQGIKGFFIHPRQGLTVPYLSEEWFHKVEVAIHEAKKHNMEVWLYDEYPYPSGVSGGQVILDHPEFQAVALENRKLKVNGSKSIELELPWGQIILARAYPIKDEKIDWSNSIELSPYIGTGYGENIFQMSGLTEYNRKRFFTGAPLKKLSWQAPEGQWILYIAVQKAVDHFKYFEKYVDTLNPKATEYYIETTHERYRRRLEHEFGKTIKGIFTDEITAFPSNLPWSPRLPKQFEKMNGYSLNVRLPALFERMGENTDKIRYDYWNTVTELFIQSYEIPVHNWCQNNNLLYVGEKPILRSKQLKYFHIPGIDAGHQKAGNPPAIVDSTYRGNGKVASSAAHFYGKPGALCECFHSIGWGMTMQDMKWIYDWLAIQGINWFVPHAFFYTTDGLTKHDAPPSSFYQMPYWKYTALLSGYIQKITNIIYSSKRKVHILLVDPVTSQWTAMGEKKAVNGRLKKDFSTLQRILLSHQLDYYIIDPDLLGKCKVVGECIEVNGERFNLLILPPMLNIEEQAFNKIKEYIDRGGHIIGTLCLPVEKIESDMNIEGWFNQWFGLNSRKIYQRYLEGVEFNDGNVDLDDTTKVLARNRQSFVSNLKEIPRVIEKLIDRDILIECLEAHSGDILTALYEKEDKKYCFLINTSGETHKVKMTLRVDGINCPEVRYVPLGVEGEHSIDYHWEEDRIVLSLEFSPYQSFMLMIQESRESYRNDSSIMISRRKIDISSHWDMNLDLPNALRLGEWNLQIEGSKVEQMVDCQPIINQVSDASIPLPVKLKDYFGCPREMEFPALKCKYGTEFVLDANMPILLVMEPGSIEGEWSIEINGHSIWPKDFMTREIYLPTNLVVNISPYLNKGPNEILVHLRTHEAHDGLVNPLYLCGDFSVFKDPNGWRITPFKGKDGIGDARGAGIPFYAGGIHYEKSMVFNIDTMDTILELYIDEPSFQDAVELYINGYCAGACAWSPYVWQIDGKWLNLGYNEIRLQISNTPIGLFEGQYFDSRQHRYIDI